MRYLASLLGIAFFYLISFTLGHNQKFLICPDRTNSYLQKTRTGGIYLNTYGYIRVSSRDQSEDRQLIALKEAGVSEQNIYLDKQSGKDFNRPQYKQLVVLDMPLLDTRRGRDLMGTFLSDIVLQILSFVAENERTNIRQRQAEGIAAAKAKGVKFGRPPLPLPDNFYEIHKAWRARKITLKEAAQACHMPVGTFYGKARKFENAA